MVKDASRDIVKVRAYSPGRYPILVLELAPNESRTAYHETGYDLDRSKPVEEAWIEDNAIGRHSFIKVDPPEEVPISSLTDYAKERTREIG